MKSNKMETKQRNSSIELLRIISMLMIVTCHFATHGGFNFDAQSLTIPKLWWYLIEMGGNFGVDVFVLITGYFLVPDKGEIFNFKKIFKFWGQILFYSIGIYLIFVIFGLTEFSGKTLFDSFFPLTLSSWWFASTYFVLYLLHPFLNIILNKIDKKTYQKLLIMLIIIWSIIPTGTINISYYQSNPLLWFIVLYSLAGYIRLYGLNPKLKRKHYGVLWILFMVLRYLSAVILIILGYKSQFAFNNILAFYDRQSILTLLSAICLFMFFEKTNMGYNKWINTIASASFGVYLIHDSNFVRPYLWLTIFKNYQYQNSIKIIPYSICVCLIVYIVCSIIDLIRQKVFEKPYMMFINKYLQKLLNPFEKICVFVKNILFGKEG